MKKLRIGIVGVGGIGNGAHLRPLSQLPECEVVAICDIKPATLKRVGDQYNIPEDHRFIDYHDLIACPDVDAVEVCTPNNVHIPIAMEVVRAGKPVNVEKPLALSVGQAQPLLDLLSEKPVTNMMCFSYRFRPATQFARKLLAEKAIGDIVSVKVEYLKDSALWVGRRLDWRFDKEIAGTGVLGDLGAHLIDMTRYLVGEFREVSCDIGTVVKRRQREDSEEWADVTTDDYAHFIARLGDTGDIFANFTISRCCLGERNSIRYDIYGTEGVISFDLNNSEVLGVCIGPVDRECGNIHTVKVPAKYNHLQEKTFVDAALGDKADILPDLTEGLACQKVIDALLLSSEEKRWVTVQ